MQWPSGRVLMGAALTPSDESSMAKAQTNVQEAEDKVAQATARQQAVVREINPLNLPQVQALLGKKKS